MNRSAPRRSLAIARGTALRVLVPVDPGPTAPIPEELAGSPLPVDLCLPFELMERVMLASVGVIVLDLRRSRLDSRMRRLIQQVRRLPRPFCGAPILALQAAADHQATGFDECALTECIPTPVTPAALHDAVRRWQPLVPPDDPLLDGYALAALAQDIGRDNLAPVIKLFLSELHNHPWPGDQVPEHAAHLHHAHSLKGAALTAGAWALAAAADRLEGAFRARRAAHELTPLVRQLRALTLQTELAFHGSGLLTPTVDF